MSRDLAALLAEAVPGDLAGPDLARIESRVARRRTSAGAAAVLVALGLAIAVPQLVGREPDMPVIDEGEPEEPVEAALIRAGAFDRGLDRTLRLAPDTDDRLHGQVIAELDVEADAVAIAADRAIGIRRGTQLAILVDGEEVAATDLGPAPDTPGRWGHESLAFDTDGTLWALHGLSPVGLRRDGTVVDAEEVVVPAPSQDGGLQLRVTGTDVSIVVHGLASDDIAASRDNFGLTVEATVVPVVGEDPLAGVHSFAVTSTTGGRSNRAQYHVERGAGLTDTVLAGGSVFGEAIAELDWQDPPLENVSYYAETTQSQVVAGTIASLVSLSLYDGSFLLVDREDGTSAAALVGGGPHTDLSVSPDGAVHLVVRHDDGTTTVRTLLTATLEPLAGPPIEDVAPLSMPTAEPEPPSGPLPAYDGCQEDPVGDRLVEERAIDVDRDGRTDRVLLVHNTDHPAWLFACLADGTSWDLTEGSKAERLEVVDLAGTPGLAAITDAGFESTTWKFFAFRGDFPDHFTVLWDQPYDDWIASASRTGHEYLFVHGRHGPGQSVVEAFGCRPSDDGAGVEFVELLIEGVDDLVAQRGDGGGYSGADLAVSYVVRHVEPNWEGISRASDRVSLPAADIVWPDEILDALGANPLCRAEATTTALDSGSLDPLLRTDAEGAGRLEHVFDVVPGAYRMNVNLSLGGVAPGELADPRHREMGAADAPTVVVGGGDQLAGEPTGPVTIFGDGEIGCPNHVADDRSLPVGTVQFEPGDRQVRVTIEVTDAAPDRQYAVELWDAPDCDFPLAP